MGPRADLDIINIIFIYRKAWMPRGKYLDFPLRVKPFSTHNNSIPATEKFMSCRTK
jgi:hypothetical protein